MASAKVMAPCNGAKTVPVTLGTGSQIDHTDKARCSTRKMALPLMAPLLKMLEKASARWFGPVALNIREPGVMARGLGRAATRGQTAAFMKERGSLASGKEKARCDGPTAPLSKAIGSKISE